MKRMPFSRLTDRYSVSLMVFVAFGGNLGHSWRRLAGRGHDGT